MTRASLSLAFAMLLGAAGPSAAIEPPVVSDRGPCRQADDAAIFTSPDVPLPERPLRAIAVSERPLEAALAVLGADGERLVPTAERRGGPPYWWYAEIPAPRAGNYRILLGSGHALAACQEMHVGERAERQNVGGAWPVVRDWSRATEDLFSAWVEKLFDDRLDAEPSWRALHEVTRDPARNFLHDHLRLGEDDANGLRLVPDCADLPYFLRAYFAWKLGLPFGYSECTRGEGGRAPRCVRWHSNLEPVADGAGELARVQRFFARDVAWAVQSGAGRAPAEDDRTDLYPTRLAPETLRPGTVYADPYGHTLVVVRRVAQTPSSGGLLLAVDAQPDTTIARKRYWRGNFLFAIDPSLGSAGFKHFRPIVRARSALRPLTNRELTSHPAWGDWSLEQYAGGVEGFYDRVDAVLSPEPLDPARALGETVDALDEQVHARVRSLANGEEWVASHRGIIAMPEGAAIFETTGAWEDYATPARDLRLLIAIDVARGFPEKVGTRPERYTMRAGATPAAVRAELEDLLQKELDTRRFDYTRSDGSTWTLSLTALLSRTEALETAYNPNDCVELRWGASPGSDEAATCGRRAPSEQQARMARYRAWFRERRRPPR